MDRLKHMRYYSCGAMDTAPDGGVQWRQQLHDWGLQFGLVHLDPTNKNTDEALEDAKIRQEINTLKSEGLYNDIRERFKIIREIDLRYIDICDFVIVRLDLSIQTCGTWEELFWANRMKKPVLVWCVQGKEKCPNWLFLTLPHEHIFSSIDDVKTYLIHINSSDNIDDLGRWRFFNWSKNVSN